MVVSLLAAVGALTLLTVLPGPDVAVLTRVGLAHGRRAALETAAGIISGLLVWGLLTVAGLAALLAASATAYTVVKLVGAAYLLVLGVLTLLHARTPSAVPTLNGADVTRSGHPYRSGLISNLLNPKMAVFYTTLLPQLVPAGLPQTPTLIGLVLLHAALGAAWLATLSVLLTRVSAVLHRPTVRRVLDRATATVLIGFGLRVALSDGI